MIPAALVAGVALAAPWQPAEQTVLNFDSSTVSTAAFGVWAGEPHLWLGRPDGLTLRDAAGANLVTLPLSVSDLHLVDLDGDGKLELLTCGSAGVHVIRGKPDAIDRVELTDQPCLELAVGAKGSMPVLLVRNVDGIAQLAPGEGGLKLVPIAGVPVSSHIAMNQLSSAALSDGLLHTAGSGGVGQIPIPPDAVGIAADAGGWLVAYAGDDPRLVRSNGTEVRLPYAPTRVRRVADQILVSMQGPAYALGGRPLRIHAAPAGATPLVLGDFNADGCADLLLTGAETRIQTGSCSGAPTRVREKPLLGSIEVGENWAVLRLEVGRLAEMQLVDGVGAAQDFKLEAGPRGLTVSTTGLLNFRPNASQVGVSRVAIQAGERHTGVIVQVVDPNPERSFVALPTRNEVDPKYRNNARRMNKKRGFFGFRGCSIGGGIALGASKNTQGSWSTVGLPDVLPTFSPAVLMSCSGGGDRLRWVLGADSAPTFFYLAPSGRMNHILAGTLGFEYHRPGFRIGPYVSGGLLVFGAGLRAQIVPFTTKQGSHHGVELRIGTFPVVPSGQVVVAYTFDFGTL